MRRRAAWFAVLILFLFGGILALYGGRPDASLPKPTFEVIAHRGAHVRWQEGTYDRATGCEAQHIDEPTLPYIENTLESIGAAFEMGATIVEIDIRKTSDGHLVIFHDWMLECRTDGTGNVSDRSLAYLQSLDIGFGYSHDGGQTYPFRGKGVGLMPTLEQVLEAFPDQKFLIDHKDGTLETAELLVNVLEALPEEQQDRLYYWGPDESFAFVQNRVPSVTRLFEIRPNLKRCALPYVATLGVGGFSEECRGMGVPWPTEYLPIAWGWPYRFLNRAAEVDMRIYVKLDSLSDAEKVADLPINGIVTDSIEVVGPCFR